MARRQKDADAFVVGPGRRPPTGRQQRDVRERFWRMVEQIRARNAGSDPDEILRDVTEAVEEVRQGDSREGSVSKAVVDTNLFVSSSISPSGSPKQFTRLQSFFSSLTRSSRSSCRPRFRYPFAILRTSQFWLLCSMEMPTFS